MIKGWKSHTTRQFAETGKSKFSGLDTTKALSRLQLLDAVTRLDEIPSLASIGLHKSCGFREVGYLSSVGYKFGQWTDVVMVQRSLGSGGA